MGCCEGGENGSCPKAVESLCSNCGTWDEEMEIWRCPSCQAKYEKDFPEKVKKTEDKDEDKDEMARLEAQVEAHIEQVADSRGGRK